MSTGPTRLILICSSLYQYAEVELGGALQIVGPNNIGKTTLIKTLQFLYLNDRRHMEFGSHSPDKTREFYFPSQYSYILFECLGAAGQCVIGWRGQTKSSGEDPSRFCYNGPFDPADFLDQKNQVREPRDVDASLSLKNLRKIKTAEEHKELLLPSADGEMRGLGIVSLRDSGKYHQFRETLKNLLTLNAITQDEMRDCLLMLADIPPDRTAFDARELFGNDYDRIRARRDKLEKFKQNQTLVEKLVGEFADREATRGELVWRWTDLRGKKQQFEIEHEKKLEYLQEETAKQEKLFHLAEAELADRRKDVTTFSEQKGGIETKLQDIGKLDKEFADFIEEMERTSLNNLKQQIRSVEKQLSDAEGESRDKAKQKLDLYGSLVKQKEQTIARYDKLAVTALRKHFSDADLNTLFRLLSRDLLEIPAGTQGIAVSREKELLTTLHTLIGNVNKGVYSDGNISFSLPRGSDPLAGIENLASAREQLAEHLEIFKRWQNILTAIEQREKLEAERRGKNTELEAKSKRIYRFEEYQQAKNEEPRLRAELKKINDALETANERIGHLTKQSKVAENAKAKAEDEKRKTEDEFNAVTGRFNQCIFPEYSAKVRSVDGIPENFDASITLFLKQQEKQDALSDEITNLLAETERWFGDEFRGEDEHETVNLLRGELEGLPDKEEALARDWNAHLHGLKATFDLVRKNMGHVSSAAGEINRAFAKVRVSNLKSVKLEVIEQSDLMSWIKRLAAFEPGGLFDNDPQQESAIANFRKKVQDNPVIHYADLFTLGVTVVGADDRRHAYPDLKEIESHGTTISIKVLFNLLLLKNQLRRDDCAVPFYLDEIQNLDPANRDAILSEARKLGFIAITAAPEPVPEVDALYFLQPRNGKIVLRKKYRVAVKRIAATNVA
jgi:hypothetical protein